MNVTVSYFLTPWNMFLIVVYLFRFFLIIIKENVLEHLLLVLRKYLYVIYSIYM